MRLMAGVIGLLCLTSAALAAPLVLVKDGQPLAQIVLAEGASDSLQTAAGYLAACVKEASGAALPVVAEGKLIAGPTQPLLLIGQTKLWPVTLPPKLDDDGFVITAQGRAVSLCGPTDWGTEFAIYDFLERYVGVRWLLPGEHGTDIPRAKTLTVPEGKVTDQPVFMSRLFSGLRGAPQGEWARRNRMHGKISFHHSLGENIFKPEKYRETHPEFFPLKDGQTRYLPEDGHYHSWQPCFSAPGSVEAAIEAICAYFKADPKATSFSLGVNDSSGHCRCPQCLKRVPEAPNFLGMRNYSELYYDWCNQVIVGVLKQYPDKWFGCLAYSEVADPPQTVKVHERLIPYMTYDRMKWVHPEVRQASEAATRSWHKVSPALGWYDYIYGTPYCLPRVWFHHSRTYLEFGRDQGVKAHYAEIYPNFGEGPKPYLFLKLWWNPKQDVDQLLKEWYVRCVGPKAAPDLAQYYALWERFWTRDVLKSKWFSVGGQYLNFSHPGYLADVKLEDIRESRRLLDATLAKCQTAPQRARARLLEKAFQYYEASAIAYQAQNSLAVTRVDTEAQALGTLKASAEALTMAQRRRRLALEEFPKDPVLVNPLGLDQFPALAGENWGGSGIWAVADWVARGDNPVRREMERLSREAEVPQVRDQAALLLRLVNKQAQNLLANSSFEEGQGGGAKGWGYWVKPGPEDEKKTYGRMLRSQDTAHTGQWSLLYDGMYRGGPLQEVACPGPGKYYAMCWVYTPPGQVNEGTLELTMGLLDDKSGNLPSNSSRIVPPAGRWTLMVVGQDVPAQIGGKPVAKFRPLPIIDSFQTGGKVYVDDVELYKVD